MKTKNALIVILSASLALSSWAEEAAEAAAEAAADAVTAATEETEDAGDAAPDAVTSASVPEVDARGAVLSFHFFGDFDAEASAAGDFSGDPRATFKQNHQALLIQAAGSSELSIMADVFHPDELFEMGISFGPYRLTVGRILIPFGEFGFHHLYGGKPDDGGLFLPKLWSDYGFSWKIPFGEKLVVDAYAVNGFDPSGFAPGAAAPRFYSVGASDNDLSKAFGARVRWTPAAFARASVSAYHDFYSDDPDTSVTFAGADGGLTFGPAELKGGFIFGLVRGPGFSKFYRWSDYAELKYNLTSSVALRLRLGAVDPDTRVNDGEDQNNANFGIIWKRGPVEYDLVYYRNLSGNDFAADPEASDSHRILLKLLVTL